jgi:hypothetical protein
LVKRIKKTKFSTITAVVATIAAIAALGSIGGIGLGQQQTALAQIVDSRDIGEDGIDVGDIIGDVGTEVGEDDEEDEENGGDDSGPVEIALPFCPAQFENCNIALPGTGSVCANVVSPSLQQACLEVFRG